MMRGTPQHVVRATIDHGIAPHLYEVVIVDRFCVYNLYLQALLQRTISDYRSSMIPSQPVWRFDYFKATTFINRKSSVELKDTSKYSGGANMRSLIVLDPKNFKNFIYIFLYNVFDPYKQSRQTKLQHPSPTSSIFFYHILHFLSYYVRLYCAHYVHDEIP